VANQKKIKRNIKQIQRVKTWQLFVLLALVGLLMATFLRLNNIGMVNRRDAVIAADESGDDKITKERLFELQRYVTAHMNADMGKGIYLEASYNRDVKDIYTAAANQNNSNGNIYKKAQEVCVPQFKSWSLAYVQCTANELAKYPSGSDLISSIKKPSPNLYLHVFTSPTWSPDFAGWSVFVFAAILTMIVARLSSVAILKLVLKYRHKSI